MMSWQFPTVKKLICRTIENSSFKLKNLKSDDKKNRIVICFLAINKTDTLKYVDN